MQYQIEYSSIISAITTAFFVTSLTSLTHPVQYNESGQTGILSTRTPNPREALLTVKSVQLPQTAVK